MKYLDYVFEYIGAKELIIEDFEMLSHIERGTIKKVLETGGDLSKEDVNKIVDNLGTQFEEIGIQFMPTRYFSGKQAYDYFIPVD